MNILAASSAEVRACITAIPERQWKEFFLKLRQENAERLANIPKEDLTDLSARAKLLQELEHGFISLREQINETKQKN